MTVKRGKSKRKPIKLNTQRTLPVGCGLEWVRRRLKSSVRSSTEERYASLSQKKEGAAPSSPLPSHRVAIRFQSSVQACFVAKRQVESSLSRRKMMDRSSVPLTGRSEYKTQL